MAAASREMGEASPQRLKDVVSGRQKCPAELVGKMAPLGVDISYVLTGVENPPSAKVDSPEAVKALRQIIRDLNRIIHAQNLDLDSDAQARVISSAYAVVLRSQLEQFIADEQSEEIDAAVTSALFAVI
ncbi:hypothetical protein [Motiliproteus sp.]|uniref:hypothetical protein n=1 Tax=Motiliproteus sp. TaxID=1898955 RepID=UPI003BAA67F5